MKRYLSFSFALMMSAILIAQTLNIEVGNVIYQIPAEKVGAISITDGATISILDKEFAISDITRMYVDDTEVEIGKDDQFFKKVFNLENALVSEFLHSFVYDSNDYSYTRITDYYQKPFSTDRSYPSPAYIDLNKHLIDRFDPIFIKKMYVETYLDSRLFRTDVITNSPPPTSHL